MIKMRIKERFSSIKTKIQRIKNKLIYSIGVHLPYNKWRIAAIRLLGYKVGNNCYIASDIVITLNFVHNRGILKIGNNVSIGNRCVLVVVSFPNFSNIKNLLSYKERIIIIEDDAWVGTGAIILPGVTIGKSSVVAAGAVVTKNVEPYTIVGGNPAKLIKRINNDGNSCQNIENKQ